MNLETIRKNIDLLDSEILKLLKDRMEQVLLTKKFKSQIEDSQREKSLRESEIIQPG
jgi:chorismate mutase